MRALLLVGLSLAAFSAGSAEARTVHLTGAKADQFITRHLPDAVIPGPAEGDFSYRDHGRLVRGHASCNVPAMGARSDGQVSTCDLTF